MSSPAYNTRSKAQRQDMSDASSGTNVPSSDDSFEKNNELKETVENDGFQYQSKAKQVEGNVDERIDGESSDGSDNDDGEREEYDLDDIEEDSNADSKVKDSENTDKEKLYSYTDDSKLQRKSNIPTEETKTVFKESNEIKLQASEQMINRDDGQIDNVVYERHGDKEFDGSNKSWKEKNQNSYDDTDKPWSSQKPYIKNDSQQIPYVKHQEKREVKRYKDNAASLKKEWEKQQQKQQPQSTTAQQHDKYQRDLPKHELKKSQNELYLMFILIALIVAGAYCFTLLMSLEWQREEVYASSSPYDSDVTVSKLNAAFKDMKIKFPHQSMHTWHTISASTKAVVRTADQPAIILMASNHKETVSCFARKIAETVSDVFEAKSPKTISRNTYLNTSSPDAVKLRLDRDLRGAFDSGTKAVVIEDIHEFHGKSALMFHAYCDHENAPFKDTVIIFTLTSENIKSEENVEEFLMSVWEDHIKYDSLTPLLSRIANNIVLIDKDTTC